MKLSNLEKKNLPTSQKTAREEHAPKQSAQIKPFNQMLDDNKGKIVLLKQIEIKKVPMQTKSGNPCSDFIDRSETLCVLLSGRMYTNSIPLDDTKEFEFGNAPIFTSCNYEITNLKVLLKLFIDRQVCFYFLSCTDFYFVD
jgi:hypothetical protein